MLFRSALTSLSDLTALTLTYCVCNSVIHHLAWQTLGATPQFDVKEAAWMFIGDLNGALLGAYLMKAMIDVMEKAGLAVGRTVADLCTGSGVVAITLALERRHCALTAVDQSADALAVASANAERLGAAVQFLYGDWFNPCAGQRYALVVSNPPYVASDDPHLEQGDLRFEPRSALDGGRGGFACLRRIAREARRHLLPGGCLMLEHGYDQAARLRLYLRELGYVEVRSRDDLTGIARVTQGVMPSPVARTGAV